MLKPISAEFIICIVITSTLLVTRYYFVKIMEIKIHTSKQLLELLKKKVIPHDPRNNDLE